MQLLDTVANGDLDDRVREAATLRFNPRGPGAAGQHSGLRLRVGALAAAAQVAGAAALAGAHRPGRPAAAAHAADAMAR